MQSNGYKTCITLICHLLKIISSDVLLRKNEIQIMALRVLPISNNLSFLSTRLSQNLVIEKKYNRLNQFT